LIPENKKPKSYYTTRLWNDIRSIKHFKTDEKKAREKYMNERENAVKELIFEPYIKKQVYIPTDTHSITKFFQKTTAPPLIERKVPKEILESQGKVKSTQKEGEGKKMGKKENNDSGEQIDKKKKPKNKSVSDIQNMIDDIDDQTSSLKSLSSKEIREIGNDLRKNKMSFKNIADKLGITVYRLRKVLDE
jgi:hypothetical protein